MAWAVAVGPVAPAMPCQQWGLACNINNDSGRGCVSDLPPNMMELAANPSFWRQMKRTYVRSSKSKLLAANEKNIRKKKPKVIFGRRDLFLLSVHLKPTAPTVSSVDTVWNQNCPSCYAARIFSLHTEPISQTTTDWPQYCLENAAKACWTSTDWPVQMSGAPEA